MTTTEPSPGPDAPRAIAHLLRNRWFALFSRVVLTLVFWTGGLAGLFDFPGRVAEMRAVGLAPPEMFAVVVTALELASSALIILNRWVWLGAGALGVFLALTVPIAHPFWSMPEPRSTESFFVALEHISLIGGLMVVAILSRASHVLPPQADA